MGVALPKCPQAIFPIVFNKIISISVVAIISLQSHLPQPQFYLHFSGQIASFSIHAAVSSAPDYLSKLG